jgi:hypothetical protein
MTVDNANADVVVVTLVASCFRGALPPVDFRAVCLVRAIVDLLLLGFASEEKRGKIFPFKQN